MITEQRHTITHVKRSFWFLKFLANVEQEPAGPATSTRLVYATSAFNNSIDRIICFIARKYFWHIYCCLFRFICFGDDVVCK